MSPLTATFRPGKPQVCLVNLIALHPPSNGGLSRVTWQVCRMLLAEQERGRVTLIFILGEMYLTQFAEWLDYPGLTILPWDLLRKYPQILDALQPDLILHPLLGTSPFEGADWKNVCAHVASMPDALALDFPEFFAEPEQERRRVLYEHLTEAAGVVTLSEHSRNQLTSHLQLDPARVHIVSLAGDFAASPRLPAGVEKPYVCYPANDWPHKRHGLLFQVFQEIHRVRPEVRLVLTGHHDAENIARLAAAAGVPAEAFLDLGRVGDDEIAGLYSHAEAMLFTSRYEGFGMPLLEAMHYGCPVICERLTSIPEIAGDAALYVEVGTAAAWAEVFLLRLPAERAVLIERGRLRSAGFSWKTSMNAYRQALIAAGLRLDLASDDPRRQAPVATPLEPSFFQKLKRHFSPQTPENGKN